ncbi:hypothetical protein EW145_g4846 [Phellinidium pouzarii]|uniref:BSD domain-containing protein n=1 Tax=Phellinidium pouzarii TaxID=167371 RepID=A0A4S4L2A9_9AGAM|nr:hypothetical protein EW145_g4846 [Phellinidium pouzarii]
MNFFDFELSRTASATPPQSIADLSSVPEPTLNEEVSQVVGQLGKLWGGFRKQSQVVFESARKDITSVVAQAQKEIVKLTTEPAVSSLEAAAGGSQESDVSPEAGPSTSSSANEKDGPPPTSEPSPFQTLLSRIQASLPPNVSATLESSLPAVLRDPAGHVHVDLAALRAEIARVQGVTRAQAEEYAHRSEALLRDAGAYIKDAVKVIPPEDGIDSGADVVFDGMGSGVVVMPPNIGSSGSGNRELALGSRIKGKGKATAAQAQQRLAGSRAAAVLARLKRDPEVIKQDPSEDDSIKEQYEGWLDKEVLSIEGGIKTAVWSERIKSALTQKEDGGILRSTRDSLVPSLMDSNTFWTRYFFRVYQIEKDEEKRKELLLAGSGSAETEDFSWEDDDDDSNTPSVNFSSSSIVDKSSAAPGALHNAHMSRDTLQPVDSDKAIASSSYPSSVVTSPSNTSPRESTDGYDVVSPESDNATDVKVKVLKETKMIKEKNDDGDDDEADSDWE